MAVEELPGKLSGWCTARTVCNGSDLTVWVAGELDVCAAPQLHGLLSDPAAHAGSDVVVDMGEVTFCDVCGLRALLSATEIRRARGARLVLRDVPPTLR